MLRRARPPEASRVGRPFRRSVLKNGHGLPRRWAGSTNAVYVGRVRSHGPRGPPSLGPVGGPPHISPGLRRRTLVLVRGSSRRRAGGIGAVHVARVRRGSFRPPCTGCGVDRGVVLRDSSEPVAVDVGNARCVFRGSGGSCGASRGAPRSWQVLFFGCDGGRRKRLGALGAVAEKIRVGRSRRVFRSIGSAIGHGRVEIGGFGFHQTR